jgi:hypothetical protein
MDIQVSLTVTSKTPISILLARCFPVFAVSAGLHCIPRVPLGTAAHTHVRSLTIKDHATAGSRRKPMDADYSAVRFGHECGETRRH